MPVNFTTGESPNTLSSAVRTFFVYPAAANGGSCGAGTDGCSYYSNLFAAGDLKNGETTGASCSGTTCVENINTSAVAYNEFYIRVLPVAGYGSASVEACSNTVASSNTFYGSCPNASGTPISMSGAEAQIDSTGESVDVLRRVQVFVATNPASVSGSSVIPSPTFALQSGSSICKRLIYGTGVGYGGGNIDEDLHTPPTPADVTGLSIDPATGVTTAPLTDPCNPTF